MDEAEIQATPRSSTAPPTLVLTRADIAEAMTLRDYRAAADEAFRAHAEGRAASPPPLHISVENGGFHAKGALLHTKRGAYVAVKLNGNFPNNPARTGLPTIQGALLFSNAVDGALLAIMDSIEVTLRRTAAATALAAHHLARADAATVAICGCGEQARAQLAALADELKLARAFAWDIDPHAARRFAEDAGATVRFPITPVDDLATATTQSDVVVTCTTSRTPFLDIEHVRRGTFVAAVGADWPEKSELTPRLMARGKVVVDVLEQCLTSGDLHHAVAARALAATNVYATLGELAADRKHGRTSDDEITIFDSTGTAIQDVAAAIRIYQRAKARRMGLVRHFGDPPTRR